MRLAEPPAPVRHVPVCRLSGRPPRGYPIHIIVTNARLIIGVVDTQSDKMLAEMRAREAPGVVDVHNALGIRGDGVISSTSQHARRSEAEQSARRSLGV